MKKAVRPPAEDGLDPGIGYHVAFIARGQFGFPSKVLEETQEFMDAISQNNPLMALQELSDLYGAIKGYLQTHHPTITMEDLATMSEATRRAFAGGHRK